MWMESADALERAQHGFTDPDIRSVVKCQLLTTFFSAAHFTQNGQCTEQRETTIVNASGPQGGVDGIPSTFDDRDRGHWSPKSRIFVQWAVAHLTDAGLAGRGSIWSLVRLKPFSGGEVQGHS